MARRGVQEGSVYRRADGRWVAVLHVGYSGGKRQRKSFYGATRQEVASRLAGAVRDLQQGKQPAPEVEKLGDFLYRWLDDTARHSIRASTYRGYEVALRGGTAGAVLNAVTAKKDPQYTYYSYRYGQDPPSRSRIRSVAAKVKGIGQTVGR